MNEIRQDLDGSMKDRQIQVPRFISQDIFYNLPINFVTFNKSDHLVRR